MTRSTTKDLVLIGGGHSHAIALKNFSQKPISGVRITLITDVRHTPYSGMLPGYVAGLYSFDECHIDLRSLTEFAKARMVSDKAIGLDLENNRVICANRPPVPFDLLSIDIGSTPATATVPGAAEHTIPVKPISQFLARWEELTAAVERFPEQKMRIGIVGGGAGGVELALAVRARLQRLHLSQKPGFLEKPGFSTGSLQKPGFLEKPGFSTASLQKPGFLEKPGFLTASLQKPGFLEKPGFSTGELHLFHRGAKLLPERNPWVGRKLESILRRGGVRLHLEESVAAVEPTLGTGEPTLGTGKMPVLRVGCSSGLEVECDRVFWVTQAGAASWLKKSGLATDDGGFILVNDALQSISHPQVFAAGDVATMVNHPRPKAGVFAVRQGQPLLENLQRSLLGKPLKPFVPQKQFLILVGTGDERAIASRGCFAVGPHSLLWRWKDKIDREFMERFANLNGEVGGDRLY